MVSSGGLRHGKIARIDDLLVVHGKWLSERDILFEGDSTLRHHNSKMQTSISRKTVRCLRTSSCQSLSRKKSSKKLFLIEDAKAGNDRRRECDADITAAVVKYDPGDVSLKNVRAACDTEKSGFGSLAKCQERLVYVGLSLDNAWSLIRPREGGFESALVSSQTVKQLFIDAQDLFRAVDSFRSTLVDISSGGTLDKKKPFQFLNDDQRGDRSLEGYARSARMLDVMALRAHHDRQKYAEISMSPALVDALNELLSDNGTDEETVCMKVHRMLCRIFFERSIFCGGSVRLFSFAVAACMCGGSETMDRLHFKDGRQVAHDMTGIVYAASYCALLEIRKYSDEEKHEDVEVETRSAMCTRTKV